MQKHRVSRLTTRGRLGSIVAALTLLLANPGPGDAQSYASGQNISPAFEGWEQNEDGSFNFLFGYMNRNWEEELDVPVGAENGFEPGPADRGQPTHFLPRRNRFVFRVRVPADWGDKELIWTLTTKGKTERAYATLRTDYLVDDVVIASETGALGAGTSSPEVRANKAPTLKVDGEKSRTVRVGQPLALVAHAMDDGVPKSRRAEAEARPRSEAEAAERAASRVDLRFVPPRQSTVGSETGLRVSWFVYRGAGAVVFDPPQIKVWEDTRAGANSPWAALWRNPPLPPDGKWPTQVTFQEPGVYVLRCLASDGALDAHEDLTITVTR
jgi:hypothetical protein